ncbi:MAG: hypothetical protein PHU85_07455 [Phycisphaerae bacterium]|nr:hypothetical protein [Phycisphaerae bacterium]
MSMELPPLVARPWPTATITNAPLRTWLPPADPMLQPRLLPADRGSAAPLRPAIDLPDPVALASPSAARTLPTYPLAKAPSADPGDVMSLPRKVRPNSERAMVLVDNTADESLHVMLVTTAALRATVAPFIRLAIPMPVESPDAMPIRATRPDDEPAILVPPPLVRPAMPTRK